MLANCHSAINSLAVSFTLSAPDRLYAGMASNNQLDGSFHLFRDVGMQMLQTACLKFYKTVNAIAEQQDARRHG